MTQPKPDFLGPLHAARFQDQSVVDRYHLRPTCPPETFRILADLISDEPRTVLDVGCGTGDIARNLLDYVEHIDAVDISLPMMEKGKTQPGGNSPKIRWLHGSAEDIELAPSYALVTAGQSIHWMDWHIVLPRFQQMLTPHGFLAILGPEEESAPWDVPLINSIKRHSTNQNYQPVDLIAELEQRHLFQKVGETFTGLTLFTQPLRDYIEAFHAKSSLSRDNMTHEAAEAFDAELRETLTPYAQNGNITVQVVGHVVWGKPQGVNI
jgi:ubiquinone/menaquinone biosynthesis C-methylase UbiE